VQPVRIRPHVQRQRQVHEAAAIDHADPDALVIAVEVDHAAGRRRPDAAQRQILPYLPLASVAGHTQAGVGVEHLVHSHAALHLVDRLVRVEQRRHWIRLPRVGLPLRIGQAKRILRLRLILRVGDQRDMRGVGGIERQLGVGDLAQRGGMIAVTVRVEIAERGHVTDAVGDPRGLDADVGRSIAAYARGQVHNRDGSSVLGVDRHHAARRVAIQRGKRPAQNFDALRGKEAEAAGLPLPVRHRRRDVVLVQTHAADAECRARAVAARTKLQVLRVVVAVGGEHPGHAQERFGQADRGLPVANRRAVDDVG